MDLQALEYTREHYNRHAGQYVDSQAALAARAAGPGAPLKKFHNQIKRHLIQRFAKGAPRLLDLCCGRGGDIWKWIDAGIQYVKGIDLSEGEVEEARHRLQEALAQRQGTVSLRCDFVATPDLGLREWREEEPYDAVTCMFAIHYFFVSESALKQFLHNVSINLKDGGYFIGTVPDGKRINACIKNNKVYQAPMLQIQAHWQGPPQCFGSPYICSIGDTVTSGDIGSMGSFEYLVYFNVLEGVAAQHGLRLVTDYADAGLDRLFEQADLRKGFKHFSPSFPLDSEPSLTDASALNVAFVFQKTGGQRGLPMPPQAQAAAGGAVQQGGRERERGSLEAEQQRQGKRARLEGEPSADKRPRLEEEPSSSVPPVPVVGTDAAAAAPVVAGAAPSPVQQGPAQGDVAKQEYKKPSAARRRTNGQTLQ